MLLLQEELLKEGIVVATLKVPAEAADIEALAGGVGFEVPERELVPVDEEGSGGGGGDGVVGPDLQTSSFFLRARLFLGFLVGDGTVVEVALHERLLDGGIGGDRGRRRVFFNPHSEDLGRRRRREG